MADITTELKLIIPLSTYRKIMAYITVCDTEITGFAEVEYNPARNAFVAGEVYLLEQEAGGAHVNIDEEVVAKFNLERIRAGAAQLPRLWWHSHVDMAAFFSAIDEEQTRDFQNETFNISLVGNKRKEMKAKCFIAESIPMLGRNDYIEIDPLPITVELEYERIPDTLRKEVEEKVKKKVYTPPAHQTHFLGDGKGRTRGTGVKKALQLPKDPTAAERRIEELGLERQWSFTLQEWTYVDPNSGQVWIDYWDSLEKFDNTYRGDDDDDAPSASWNPEEPDDEIEKGGKRNN